MKKKRFLYFTIFIIVGISFYFNPFKKRTSSRIPVLFVTSSYHPIIKGHIQGNPFSFHVDCGACDNLYLTKMIFNKIQKTECKRISKTMDFRGNKYDDPLYSVSDIKIGSINLPVCEVAEEGLDFHKNTGLWPSIKRSKYPEYHGRIGLEFFKDGCVLFDFPGSSIFISKTLNDLEKEGLLSPENFIRVPFTMKKGVIFLSIETDLNKHNVILDSGSSFCLLNKSILDPKKVIHLPNGKCYYPSNKLMINGCDFGDWKFAVVDSCEELGGDGALGVDFFLEHAVCIDFVNQVAYIKKPVNVLATQWRRGKFYVIQFFLRNFSDFPKVEDYDRNCNQF